MGLKFAPYLKLEIDQEQGTDDYEYVILVSFKYCALLVGRS